MPEFFVAAASVLGAIFFFLKIMVFGSVIMSWVNADPRNQIVQMVNSTCEILYRPLRPLTRKIPGPIDWAPFAALLLIMFLERWLVPVVARLGSSGF